MRAFLGSCHFWSSFHSAISPGSASVRASDCGDGLRKLRALTPCGTSDTCFAPQVCLTSALTRSAINLHTTPMLPRRGGSFTPRCAHKSERFCRAVVRNRRCFFPALRDRPELLSELGIAASRPNSCLTTANGRRQRFRSALRGCALVPDESRPLLRLAFAIHLRKSHDTSAE